MDNQTYQLELKQIVEFPRCRIYRDFIRSLVTNKGIRTNGGFFLVRAWPCSPLRSFSLIRKTELWRTNKPPALRVVKIALALCKKPPLIRNRDSMKSLITSLIKQGRIYYDQDKDLICDTPEASDSPDYGMIAAVWVLLDFKEAVVYHTSGEFPVKLHFFSQDEVYEVIYVSLGQEALINHVLASLPSKDTNRLVILESEQQAAQITIDGITAFCLVTPEGTVNYYAKQKKRG